MLIKILAGFLDFIEFQISVLVRILLREGIGLLFKLFHFFLFRFRGRFFRLLLLFASLGFFHGFRIREIVV